MHYWAPVDSLAPDSALIENIVYATGGDQIVSDTAVTMALDSTTYYSQITVSKDVDSAKAVLGDTLIYMLTVRNIGNETSGEVALSDDLPAYVRYVANSASPTAVYDSANHRLSWTISGIGPNGATGAAFRAVIDSTTPIGTEIQNVALADYDDSTVADTATTSVIDTTHAPRLRIQKSVDSPSAVIGDTLTYTIKVVNSGNATATDVTVIDPLPPYVTYLTNSASGGGIYDSPSRTLTWHLDSVSVGQSLDLGFKVTLATQVPNESEIRNFAMVIGPDTTSSDTTATFVRPSYPNLSLTKSVDSAVASPGSVISYAIALINSGAGPGSDIVITDSIPGLTSYIPGSASSFGLYLESADRVQWRIDNLDPHDTVYFTFRVRIDSSAVNGDTVTNVAQAGPPFNLHSNPVKTAIDVPTGSPDDLRIIKTVNLDAALVGDTLVYTVQVSNVGVDIIGGIVLEDAVPDNTEYVTGSATGGAVHTSETSSLLWNVGTLFGGQSVSYQLRTVISAIPEGDRRVMNQAFVTAPDLVAGNQVFTLVVPGALGLTKAVDNAAPSNGDTVTYTINYVNASTTAVANVVITDTLAAGLQYVPASASNGGYYFAQNRVVRWTLGSIAAHASGSVQFRATFTGSVKNGDILSNFAVITGGNDAPQVSNTVDVTVLFPSISLSKTAGSATVSAGQTLEYTVIAINSGLAMLRFPVLIDSLPSELTYIDGSIRYNGDPIDVVGTNPLTTVAGPAILPGDTVVITYSARVAETIQAGATFTNSALMTGTVVSGTRMTIGPVHAAVTAVVPQLRVTKTVGQPSAGLGGLVRYTVRVENLSPLTAVNAVVFDSMPNGIYYVEHSTTINGATGSEPNGANPYRWTLPDIAAGATTTLMYSAVVGADAVPGLNENVAWARATIGLGNVTSPHSGANINVLTTTLPGAIRGRVVVDCDGDGVADMDTVPVGADVYLDDGSQSRVNNKGMFYFSTVRAGARVVALDERDLDGFYIPDGAQASQFVHVNEAGESYVLFRVCPDVPRLEMTKQAAPIPTVRVTKTATVDLNQKSDSSGVVIDYELAVESNGHTNPVPVRVIDSLPGQTRLILSTESAPVTPSRDRVVSFDVIAGQQSLHQSVLYSLEDLAPGVRQYLQNQAYLEGNPDALPESSTPVIFSEPANVMVGPFRLLPAQNIKIDVVGAQFATSIAALRPEAIPVLSAIADSIKKYDGAKVRIEGHADYRPIHTRRFPSNLELSTARAKSVYEWLIAEGGIDSSRMTFEGFGATRPRDSARTPEALQKNRRVEVYLDASRAGGVDLSALTQDRWHSSTVLELPPVNWDTLVQASSEAAGATSEMGDTWQVRLRIVNRGPGDAEQVAFSDPLPENASFIDGSARIDGVLIDASITTGNRLTLTLNHIVEGASVVLTYRIKPGRAGALSGGGAATASQTSSSGQVIDQKSNAVRFK